MPNVTPYTGLAKGNGFPFCLERVNVADKGDGTPYDYWTTLGGTNKGNVAGLTPEQKTANISLSWQNAWRLYWNAYGMNYTSETNTGGISENLINADNAPFKWGFEEPSRRICKIDPPEFDYTPGYGVRFMNGDGFNEPIGISIHSLEDFGIGDNAFPIIRMYNRDVTDEDNFIGYGLGRIDSPIVVAGAGFLPIYGYRVFAVESDGGNYSEALVALISHTIDESAFQNVDYAYVTLNGIHFLCAASGFASGADSSVTLDASSLNASAQVPENSPDATVSASVTIDSIEFYNQ